MSLLKDWLLEEINFNIENGLLEPISEDMKMRLVHVIHSNDGLWQNFNEDMYNICVDFINENKKIKPISHINDIE